MSASGGWQTPIMSIMGTMLVTGLVAWFSFGGGVSRAEGDELKDTDAQLKAQQAVIEERLARQQMDIIELKRDVKEGNAATQNKLDKLLERLPRDTSPHAGD